MIVIQESGTPRVDSRDPMPQIRRGIAALAGEDRSGWAATAKSQRVQELLEIRDRLDAVDLIGLYINRGKPGGNPPKHQPHRRCRHCQWPDTSADHSTL